MKGELTCRRAAGFALAAALLGGCSAQGAPQDFEDVTAQADEADEAEGLVAKLASPRGDVYFFRDDEGGAFVAASRPVEGPEVFDTSLLRELPPVALYEMLTGQSAPEALSSLDAEPLLPEAVEAEEVELAPEGDGVVRKSLDCWDWVWTWINLEPTCGHYYGNKTVNVGQHYRALGEIRVNSGTVGDDLHFRLQAAKVSGYRNLVSIRPKVGEHWWFAGNVQRYHYRKMRWVVTDANASGGLLGTPENNYSLAIRFCSGANWC